MFQSTLPYGERQKKSHYQEPFFVVSIHAPVWGATRPLPRSGWRPYGFNPRSRMGSDQRPACLRDGLHSFNPRSRMGSDHICENIIHHGRRFQSTLPYGERPGCACINQSAVVVSIHAPVWGATAGGLDRIKDLLGFNPRSRMGSDDLRPDFAWHVTSFNPRSRMGSDSVDCGGCFSGCVSIHAPVWGATKLFAVLHLADLFQSTLPYGERPKCFS